MFLQKIAYALTE